MRCHHVVDEKTGERVYIPRCWGSVVHGPDYCTCYPAKITSEESEKDREIRELVKENARLRRIIEKISNRSCHVK